MDSLNLLDKKVSEVKPTAMAELRRAVGKKVPKVELPSSSILQDSKVVRIRINTKRTALVSIDEVERYAEVGLSLPEIASIYGLTLQKLLGVPKESQFIQEAYDRGRALGMYNVMSAIYSKAKEGNTVLAIYYTKIVGYRSDDGSAEERLKRLEEGIARANIEA